MLPVMVEMRTRSWSFLGVIAALACGCDGCPFFDDSPGTPGTGGIGEPCGDDDDCRPGLECGGADTCASPGNTMEGGGCQLTVDCAEGLYCDPSRRCAIAGAGTDGADCESTAECVRELVCTLEGFSGRCRAAGMGDLGDPCSTERECLAGLTCSSLSGAAVCSSLSPPGDGGVPLPPSLPSWAGEECEIDDGTPRAYFEVPRFDGGDRDFYRLPYPNDVRMRDGHVDLRNHPSPATVLPIDVIDRYLRASEEDLTGFGVNSTVFFRFSKPYVHRAIDGRVAFVNIDPESTAYQFDSSLTYLTTSGPVSRYICDDWLAVRTRTGSPLLPNTTYAIVLLDGIASTDGAEFERDADFDAMLGESAPADPVLAAAWSAYAPLRAWLADPETRVAAARVLNAAVFTTADPEARIAPLRAAIRERPIASVRDLTLCGAGVTSPCDDGTPDRVCGPENADYHEIHGRIGLPIFQAGTAPYENPGDGGGFAYDDGGRPLIARTEDVCFALTVPKSATPETGFPLVVYGHGTGGSFTAAIANGIAADVANGSTGELEVHAATLTIDLPQHGARRGESTRGSDVLFYNFANPRAARDNVLQGSADLLSLVHFATLYTLDAADSPTADRIAFDEERIVWFTHSQGSSHSSIVFPWEPGVSAVVLSGQGGDLTQSLLHKREPIDIAAAIPFALLDADGAGRLSAGEFHPVLAIFQAFFDSVDSVNYARRAFAPPASVIPGGPVGNHVFMTYGLGDSYSPEETMRAFSQAGGYPLVRPLRSIEGGWQQSDAPLSGNATLDMMSFTIGMRQYEPPAGQDGHFVATRSEEGRADVTRFVLMALAGQIPQIGM
jgi:hypothetical protein